MKSRALLIFLIMGLVPLMSWAGPPALPAADPASPAPDVEALLNRLEQQYAGREFQADFHQISTLTALEVTETASGKAFFSHPGKMRWQYTQPNRHEIITDGKTLWIHRPDEHQVVVGDARSFFDTGAGGAFLSNIETVRKQYTARSESLDKDHVALILTPIAPSTDIQSIAVKIMESTGYIVQVVTTNPYGDTTTLDFWNIQFGPIDDALFQFSPPEGMDIIDMN